MYGETGAAMRAEFAALLRQHRIQQRLVGTTAEEREELGGLIRTYRQTCHRLARPGHARRKPIGLLQHAAGTAESVPGSRLTRLPPDRSQRTGAGDRHRKTAVERAPRVDGCSGHAERQPDGGPMAPRRPRSGPRRTRHQRAGVRADDRAPGSGSRRRRRRADPSTGRPRPAVQEHTRLGAARPERSSRLGIAGCGPRREPRPT